MKAVIEKIKGSAYFRPVAREALSGDQAFQLRPQYEKGFAKKRVLGRVFHRKGAACAKALWLI